MDQKSCDAGWRPYGRWTFKKFPPGSSLFTFINFTGPHLLSLRLNHTLKYLQNRRSLPPCGLKDAGLGSLADILMGVTNVPEIIWT